MLDEIYFYPDIQFLIIGKMEPIVRLVLVWWLCDLAGTRLIPKTSLRRFQDVQNVNSEDVHKT